MEIITIDGMVEHDFRNSIEDMLRLDQVDEAIARLGLLLQSCAGMHEILPPRFLTATYNDIEIVGWDRLAYRLLDHDRPNHPISALGVTLADARALGGPGPARGRLAPFIKTFYFSDDAYPFSDATRSDLLDGYSREGFEWQGDYQATDATLAIKGIDDLYGAIIELEDRLLASKSPPDDEVRAGTIGACFVATLIHQALRQTIREKGLPRPLCVLAACDGVYPFFDAPVAGSDECTVEAPTGLVLASDAAEDEPAVFDHDDEPADDLPGEGSLLTLITRKGLKAPVMILGEDDAREAARYSEMAGAQRLGVEEGFVLERESFADVDEVATGSDMLLPPQPVWRDDPAQPDAFDDGDRWDDANLQDTNALALALALASAEADFEPAGSLDPRGQPDLPELALTTTPDTFGMPFAPPASHSLRARINLAPPDTSRTLRDRIADMINRLSCLILRR